MKIKYGLIEDANRISAHYDGGVTAAIIGAGATLASGATQAALGGRMNKRALRYAKWQNQQNQEFAREQNQWNLDLWNKANEYNSPAAQKQRLIDAGYNPNLYDPNGNLAATQPNSADLANQVAPSNDAAALGMMQQGVSNMMQSPITYLQQLKAKNEIQNLASHNDEIKANTDLLKKNSHLSEVNAQKVATEIDELNSKIRNLDVSTRLLNQKIITEKSIQNLNAHQVRKIGNDIGISRRQMDLQEKLAEYQIRSILKGIEVSDVEIKKMAKETINLGFSALLTRRQIHATDLQNIYQGIINKYADSEKQSELDARLSQIYSNTSNILTKTIDYGQSILSGALLFKRKPDIQGALIDRVNNRYGVNNQW